MCGIAGFVGPKNETVLKRMVGLLEHRGPDDEGFWQSGTASLGMRRLSIIDVETGQQPVSNADGSVVAVFNGEIYNAPALRAELENEGAKFRSDHSDTEVIIPLYEKFGASFVDHLRGMFAIALWDERQETLLLYRDRTGIKPLYYAVLPSGLVFGSEIKALLAHPEVSREPNFPALHHYLSLKNTPAPETAFKHIHQIKAGHMLIRQAGQSTVKRWWKADFGQQFAGNERDAIAEVRRLLEESVLLHMQSDVPFGAYLSGGVDSSSVVALMAKQMEQPVKTFTLTYEDNFENKDRDKTFARDVAEQYGTEHHEFCVRFEDVPARIDEIVRAFDEPFSGVISTYYLTQLISEHVKVCLSGDGADELFGSYLSPRMARPLELRSLALRENRSLNSEEFDSLGEWRDRVDELDAVLTRGDYAEQRMTQYISNDALNRGLYSEFMLDALSGITTSDLIRVSDGEYTGSDATNRALHLDFETLLPDQVLQFVDKLSMAHSVEVRPPFLDHKVVEFAVSLPGSMKIKSGRVKHILKEAVRGLIPDDIIDRSKEGFLMPINHWILNNLKDYVYDMLGPSNLSRHGLLKAEAIETLLSEHYAGKVNNGNRIWNLLNLQLWWNAYIDR